MRFKKMVYWVPALWLGTIGPLNPHALAQSANPDTKQAQAAMAEGRYTDAETHWNQVIDQAPNSAEAHYHLGVSLHQQYRLKDAILAYQKAIQLDPRYDLPYINMGLAWIEGQRLDKATQAFRQVLALPDRDESPASNHTLAHYNLAIILKRQDQPDEALKEVQAALSITPDFAPAQELLQVMQ